MLGPQSNFGMRALYDVWDVTALLQPGCNCLGVTVGHGWGSNTHVHENLRWDRQFIALLSITDASGRTTVYPSQATAASAPPRRAPAAPLLSDGSTSRSSADALRFTAAAGPVTYDDVFDGEAFDGRVATAMRGWDTCEFPAGASWEQTSVPPDTPPVTTQR